MDYLVVVAPPGTSEHIFTVQYLRPTGIDGAIIVTTPQDRKSLLLTPEKEVSFCKKVGVPVLGKVENMGGLALMDVNFMKLLTETASSIDVTQDLISCIKENAPELLNVVACSEVFDSSGGDAERVYREMGVPFLGKVPVEPQLGGAAEQGKSCFEDYKCLVSAPALKSIIHKGVPSMMAE